MPKVMQSGLVVFPDILVAILLIATLSNTDYASYVTYLSTANLILLLSGIINSKIVSAEILKRPFIIGVVISSIIIFSITVKIASDLNFNWQLYQLFLLNSLLIIFSNILDAYGTRGGYLEKLFIGQYTSGVIKVLFCIWLIKFGYDNLIVIVVMITFSNFVQTIVKFSLFLKTHSSIHPTKSTIDNSVWFFLNPIGVNLFFGLDIILLNYLKIDLNVIGDFARCKQLISIVRQFANILISIESAKIADLLSIRNFNGMYPIVNNFKRNFALIIFGLIFTSLIFKLAGFWKFDLSLLLLISVLLLFNWKNRVNTQIILINGRYLSASTLGLLFGGTVYLLLLSILSPVGALECVMLFFVGLYLKSLVDRYLVRRIELGV